MNEKNIQETMKQNITLDIYNLIRSKDVGDYCRQIGHIFTPLEMAIIIDRSEITTIEKLSAWQILIDHYPNMPLHNSVPFKVKTSLHDYLRASVDFYMNIIKQFYKKEKNAKYSICIYSLNQLLEIPNPNGLVEIVNTALCEKEKRPPHPLSLEYDNLEDLWKQLRLYWNKDGPQTIGIMKEKKRSQFIDFDRNGKIVHVEKVPNRYNGGPGYLQDLFLHIPVPFKNGDLVYMCYNHEEPILLKEINTSITNRYISGESIGDCDHHKEGYATVLRLINGCLSEEGIVHTGGRGYLYKTDQMCYWREELQGEYKIFEVIKDYYKCNPNTKEGQKFKDLIRYQRAITSIMQSTAILEECKAEKNELIDYWKYLTESTEDI